MFLVYIQYGSVDIILLVFLSPERGLFGNAPRKKEEWKGGGVVYPARSFKIVPRKPPNTPTMRLDNPTLPLIRAPVTGVSRGRTQRERLLFGESVLDRDISFGFDDVSELPSSASCMRAGATSQQQQYRGILFGVFCLLL